MVNSFFGVFRLDTWRSGGLCHVIPDSNDRLFAAIVFERQLANASGAAQEMAPRMRRQAKPAGRDHPDDVAARKRKNLAGPILNLFEETVGPRRDVVGGLAAWAAVAV
jgi:hypothetical protein